VAPLSYRPTRRNRLFSAPCNFCKANPLHKSYYGRPAKQMRTLYFCPIVSSFLFFFSPNLSGRRLDVFHTWCGLSANLGCRSETCCMRLAENTGRKISPNIRHLRTIVQLCRAISQTKLVKQQYPIQTSPQYGELRPTGG